MFFLICNIYNQFMFYYEHHGEEGEVFRMLKRQCVAIVDQMFTPDIYIWEKPQSRFPAS
jgi:hypothetical protein